MTSEEITYGKRLLGKMLATTTLLSHRSIPDLMALCTVLFGGHNYTRRDNPNCMELFMADGGGRLLILCLNDNGDDTYTVRSII